MSGACLWPVLLFGALAQDIELEKPLYWPAGKATGPNKILQSYGQYETVKGVSQFHRGLDVDASVDEAVLAPMDGTVVGIYCTTCLSDADGAKSTSDPYGSVMLAADGADWGLTVSHIYDIVPPMGEKVVAGSILGYATEWTTLADFEHVHLGMFACKDCAETPEEVPPEVYGPRKTYIANPLEYLLGAEDLEAPVFLEIENDGDVHFPLAFLTDPTNSNCTFHDAAALPEKKLDVLVHAEDRFAGGVLAPAGYYLRITRLSDVQVVHEALFDFSGELPEDIDLPYVQAGGFDPILNVVRPELPHSSSGWPDPDFYVLLTSQGPWDTADEETGGEGEYQVLVATWDAPLNFTVEYVTATVKLEETITTDEE